MGERPMIVCITREQLPVPAEEVSHIRTCENCGAQIWVGNSTLVGVAEEYPASLPRLLCLDCAGQEIAASGEHPDFKLPKYTEQVLRGVLGDEAVAQFKSLFEIDS